MLDEIISATKRVENKKPKISLERNEKANYYSFIERRLEKNNFHNASLSRHLRVGKQSVETF